MSHAVQRRYFDNAATSHPKPAAVAGAMARMLTEVGGPGRGMYAEAREAAGVIALCRRRIARLVNLAEPNNVVFGYNTTDGLNLAIKGAIAHLRATLGAAAPIHVVSTYMEHNSVLRPMHALMACDPKLEWTRVGADPASGMVDPDDIRRAIVPGRTRLVIVNHASNVTGTLQDLASIGCAVHEACPGEPPLLIVDGAQSLGHAPVDMQAMRIDMLAFPGHKGLLGPTGTGGLCIRPGVEKRIATIREGGTGSLSEQEMHPFMMPEKFEAGSHNTVGIAGLSEGVAWLLERGVASVREHEIALMHRILPRVAGGRVPGLTLLGPTDVRQRVGVFSFTSDVLSPAEMATILESEFGVLSRAGLHCAPLAHQTFGTSPPTGQGACRLSLGPFLSEADADFAVDALEAVVRAARPVSA